MWGLKYFRFHLHRPWSLIGVKRWWCQRRICVYHVDSCVCSVTVDHVNVCVSSDFADGVDACVSSVFVWMMWMREWAVYLCGCVSVQCICLDAWVCREIRRSEEAAQTHLTWRACSAVAQLQWNKCVHIVTVRTMQPRHVPYALVCCSNYVHVVTF